MNRFRQAKIGTSRNRLITWLGVSSLLLLIGRAVTAQAQGTLADYERATRFLTQDYGKVVFKLEVTPNWIGDSSRFWYCNQTRQGKEFVLVDPEEGTRKPAFDHAKLAAVLSQTLGKECEPDKLPFDTIEFVEAGKKIRFDVEQTEWTCVCDLVPFPLNKFHFF